MYLVFAHQRHQILKCFVIESPESFPCGIFFTLRRNTFSKDFEILRFFFYYDLFKNISMKCLKNSGMNTDYLKASKMDTKKTASFSALQGLKIHF